MNRNTAFFARSEAFAEGFLQTAVVVDDRAFVTEQESDPVGPLAQPATPSTITPRTDGTAVEIGVGPPLEVVAFAPEAHRLDAQPVIDGFARRGIVCAVLKRVPDDTLNNPTSRLSRLAGVADIMVLDWHVSTGRGERLSGDVRIARNRGDSEIVTRRRASFDLWSFIPARFI